jgi:hypothetical protein
MLKSEVFEEGCCFGRIQEMTPLTSFGARIAGAGAGVKADLTHGNGLCK